MAPSDSMAHKVHKVAEQLLAAAGKFIDVGSDLNGMPSCMVDVAGDAKADDRDLNHASHILAWAGWTGDLTSDALNAVDDLLRAIGDLIGAKGHNHGKAQARQDAASTEARIPISL